MQCSYFVYINDFIANIKDPNMRLILKYKLSTSHNIIETKPNSIIEVPYYDEDEDPSIQFEIIVVYQDQEKKLKAFLKFADCELTQENSRGIYKLQTLNEELNDQNSKENISFVLIVEVKAICDNLPQKTQLEDDTVIRKRLKEDIQILGVDVIKKTGYKEFLQQRKIIIDQSSLLKTTKWSAKYRLDIKLTKQSYQFYLDDEDSTTVYYFFLQEDDRNITLDIKLIESIYDEYNFQTDKNQIKLTSTTPIGSNQSINLTDFFLGENQNQTAFLVDYEMFLNLKITLKFTFLKQNHYIDRFLGYMAIKVLETKLFSSDLRPISLEFRLKSLNPLAIPQSWVLKPFDNVVKQDYVLSTWDFQHSLLINKLNQKKTTIEDQQTQELDTEALFNSNQNEKLDPVTVPFNNEFTESIKYYDHITEYEPILQADQDTTNGLKFSQRENHIFFKTTSPLDYLEIAIEGQPIVKDKKVQGNYIGSLSSSLFKVPQNQLIIGFIVKSKNGKVELRNCLAQYENDDDDEDTQDLDDLLDNEIEELIGTIKYYVVYQGYNDTILEKKNWINKLSNIDFNAINFLNLMKSNFNNKISTIQKQYVISLKLDEIWNLFDMFLALGFEQDLELAVKLGQISYSIPFTVSYENRAKLQSDKNKQTIVYQLDMERKKCVVVEEGDKKKFYFVKNNEEYAVVTVDQDISGNMIFQVCSHMDSLIVSLRQLQSNQLYCFTSEPLRELFMVQDKGSFIIPMKIISSSKLTNVFFCQFSYKILNNDDLESSSLIGQYEFGVFIPPQGFPQKVAQLARLEIYEIQVESIVGDLKRYHKQMNFNQTLLRFNTEKIIGAEYWRKGQLLVKVSIKKVSSYIDDSFSNSNNNTLKEQIILINPEASLQNPLKPDQVINVKANQYQLLELQFKDEKVSSHHIKVILYIGFKSSQFLQNPKGQIIMTIPQSLEDKMLDSNIFVKETELRFKLQTTHVIDKKLLQTAKPQKWIVGQNNDDMSFQTYHHNDNIVFQDSKDGKVGDSDLTRISQLILIPWIQYQELVGQKSQQVEQIANDSDEDNKSIGSVLSDKKDTGLDTRFWSFISYNDKRLEFLVQIVPSLENEELEAQKKLQLDKKNKEILYLAEKQRKREEEKLRTVNDIRAAIIVFQDENNQLGTKIQRERKVYEKSCLQYQQLKDLDEQAQNATQIKQRSTTTQSNQIQNSTYVDEVSKAKLLYKFICQCGEKNPKFNGFCGECVKKMREDYEAAQKDYMPIAASYEQQHTKNMNIDLKMVKIKNKIKNLKGRLNGTSDDVDIDEKLIKDEINYLKQQNKLIEVECTLLKNDSSRMIDEKTSTQQDLEQRIAKKSDKIKTLQEQIQEIDQKTADLHEIVQQNQNEMTNDPSDS